MLASTGGPIMDDYGRRTPGTELDDNVIETKINVNIDAASDSLAQAPIDVASFNGAVLLVGQVASEEDKKHAGEIARKTRKVKQVHNELEVIGPLSTLAAANDNWLATKLRSKIMLADDIQSSRVELVVENSVVYLMGLLTSVEAERVVDAARNTSGVTRVVTIFEYIE